MDLRARDAALPYPYTLPGSLGGKALKDQATVVTHFLLGKALAGLGLLDRAVAHLRRAVTAEPEYFDAWMELGLTHE